MAKQFDFKPRPVLWHEQHFRSSIEGRWAYFFETLLIHYIFEGEFFDVGYNPYGGLETYLPDFRLVQQGCWIEVKGAPPTDEERWKISRVAEITGLPGYIFYGPIPEWSDEQGNTSAIRFLPDGREIENCWWTRCSGCRGLDIMPQGVTQCACGYRSKANIKAYEDPYILNALRLARKVKLPR